MKKMDVKKLAVALKVVVLIMFVGNLLALFMVPGLVGLRMDWQALLQMSSDPQEPVSPVLYLLLMWPEVFRHVFQFWKSEHVFLTLFLLLSGTCTTIILWQGKRVLDTIIKGNPFLPENTVSLNRAAVCCFVISGAALARLVWSLCFFRSPAYLATYNTLFIPLFLMGGLLCMVMAALFRQATELKEENDLTI